MKRLLSFLTFFFLLATTSLSETRVTIEGISYRLTGTEAEVARAVDRLEGSINIPSSIVYKENTYSVTSIGEKAFHDCSSLISVTIPNSVTSIGEEAFDKCKSLTSIDIPNSVTTIGRNSFYECTSLTSIDIPNSVTSIGEGAFAGCGLTSIDIPNSVTKIERGVFGGCSSLTSVTIPNSVTSIEENAFWECTNLTSVTIPNSVTKIERGVFGGCRSLTSVTIPNSVTSIGERAFLECTNLTSVTIPNSVTSIGRSAFVGCGLTSIDIPNSVTSIEYDAFDGCAGLTSVTFHRDIHIPDFSNCSSLSSVIFSEGVTRVDLSNFRYFDNLFISGSVISINSSDRSIIHNLESIVVAPTNPKYDSREGCNAIIETATNTLIHGCKNTTIPNSVTSIGSCAFESCTGLTSINIPDNVTSIGYYAFLYCKNLTSVHIPNSVTAIMDETFKKCISLTSINIPNSVTTIGRNSFYECTSLTSIDIPNSVTSIGEGAFILCTALASVTMSDNLETIEDGAFGGCTSLPVEGNIRYADTYLVEAVDRNLSTYTIKEGTKYIGGAAFANCSSLTLINIPNSVMIFGDNVFLGCTSLPVEGGLRYADTYLVETAGQIQSSYTIKEGTRFIGYEAFIWRDGTITSVTIPNSVISIEKGAFMQCTGLTSIDIPNSVTRIRRDAFSGCTGLTSIDIPNSVTSIGRFAFSGCGLTSIDIPNSVTSIGREAFYFFKTKYVISHIDLTLHDINVDENAFNIIVPDFEFDWDSYDSYEAADEAYEILYAEAWKRRYIEGTLYVPAGMKGAYESRVPWNLFKKIVEFGNQELKPADGPHEVDMGTSIPGQTDLRGAIFDNTYYDFNPDNGDRYDDNKGCVVLGTPIDNKTVDAIYNLPIGDEQLKELYKGLIFAVPAGSGLISVTAETVGTKELRVKIGSNAALSFSLTSCETVKIPYTVSEPSYVYLYAGEADVVLARGSSTTELEESCVRIYSYKWEPAEATGIQETLIDRHLESAKDNHWYTLDGKKLNGRPTKKGVYIKDKTKVVVE